MRIEFDHQGKRIQVEAQWVKGQLWVHLNGRNFIYESESDQKRARGGASRGHASDVLAPMPGKVTKILGVAGQEVQKGTALVVMEAMKMEYTLKSEGPGTIEAVQCQVGDQVTLGKVLVKIKPAT